MRVNNLFNQNINTNIDKVNENINNIANPKNTKDVVDKFIQDVFEMRSSSAKQEIKNMHEAIGFMQIADSALNNISKDLQSINALEVRKNNATLNEDNLAAINSQISKYQENINRTLQTTKYNGKTVFGEFNFNGLQVNTYMPEEFNLENKDTFTDMLNQARSSIGSFQNELNRKIDNLSTYYINNKSVVNEHTQDIAQNYTDMKNNEIKLTASMLTQAHQINLAQINLMNLLG